MRSRRILLLSLALLPAACAHTGRHDAGHHARRHHGAADHPPEHALHQAGTAGPTDAPGETGVPPTEAADVELPAATPTLRDPVVERQRIRWYGTRDLAASDTIRIEPRAGGWEWVDLLRLVSEEAKVSIRYQAYNAVIKGKKVSWIRPMDVARTDLVAWVQDLAFFDGIVIVPQGPSDRGSYVVMDVADANASGYPVFVPEDELAALAGRVGLYVTSVLTLPEGADPSRVRQALSQMSTKVAGLGRLNDLGKDSRVILVADFAAVVANMRRTLDEIAVRNYEDSVR